jgi:peptidoglycan LD-endopeptidase LytH
LTRHKQFLQLVALTALLSAAALPAAAAIGVRKPAPKKAVAVTKLKPAPKTVKAKKPVATLRRRSSSRVVVRNRRLAPMSARAVMARYIEPDFSTFTEMVPPLTELTAADLQDSFLAARVGRRVHHAIDIMRHEGTPLVACVDGFVERLETSRLGGIAVYLVDAQRRYRFYYAHLSAYAEGLTEGMPVLRGAVLGYVGSTGNASPDAPHLHFQIMQLGESGAAGLINPYPVLRHLVDNGAAPPEPQPMPTPFALPEPPPIVAVSVPLVEPVYTVETDGSAGLP